MPGVTLLKVRQFEDASKIWIINRFGNLIPEEKINLLYSKSFVDEKILENADEPQKIFGAVLRTLLSCVINIKCKKELEVAPNESEPIYYGEYLEKGIIELYVQELASKYNISVDERLDLKDNLDMATKIREKLGIELDSKIFINNAISILEAAQLDELTKKCDEEAIKSFQDKKEKSLNKDEKTNTLIDKEMSKDSGVINIVYLGGKQYVQYIDENNEVRLVETHDPDIVSELYREIHSKLKPGEKLDSKYFFDKLTKSATEINLRTSDETNKDLMNKSEKDMNLFTESNKPLKDKADNESVTHSFDGNIHVIEATNEIVTTEDHKTHIEGELVNPLVQEEVTDDTISIIDIVSAINEEKTLEEVKTTEVPTPVVESTPSVDSVATQNVPEVKVDTDVPKSDVETSIIEDEILSHDEERILSPEEQQKLITLFANGHDLSAEELKALRRSIPKEFIEQRQEEPTSILEESGPKMALTNKNSLGFTNKWMVCYIVVLTICLGIILGAMLFKLMS